MSRNSAGGVSHADSCANMGVGAGGRATARPGVASAIAKRGAANLFRVIVSPPRALQSRTEECDGWSGASVVCFFSALLGNVFSDGGNDIVGLPLVRGVPLDDLAILADEHGGERVREGFAVAGSYA